MCLLTRPMPTPAPISAKARADSYKWQLMRREEFVRASRKVRPAMPPPLKKRRVSEVVEIEDGEMLREISRGEENERHTLGC